MKADTSLFNVKLLQEPGGRVLLACGNRDIKRLQVGKKFKTSSKLVYEKGLADVGKTRKKKLTM